MAARKVNTEDECRRILYDVEKGVFKPVYLLMGDEPFFPERVCSAILAGCIDEASKDFNETVCYGGDVTADQIVTAARRYPMMADRQLVVVKEAQRLEDIDRLESYFNAPLDSTVLVLLFTRAVMDKRKSVYKAAVKVAEVLDSPAMRDYEVTSWISRYYASRGLSISPEAVALLQESAGTDLSTIAVETDKLLKNLPEGASKVEVKDIEKNVGVSRQFSIFELTKALGQRDSSRALKTAAYVGNAAKFRMPGAVNAIFAYFFKLLRYGLLLASGSATPERKAEALEGTNPYFYREYDAAVRLFPPAKSEAVLRMLCEYDYLGKGGDGGTDIGDSELLMELTAKILNV